MIKSLFFALALAAASGSTAFAQTAEEKAACRSDAMKYCSANVGKPQAMNACLKEHKTDLSDACRKVVEARGG